MDLVPSCKHQLAYFRIKELKDVLTQLGLAKQGKKQDLVDRILSLLSDEQGSKSHGWTKKNSVGKDEVAKIIDDTYRKMQAIGATDLASKSHSNSDLNHVKPKEEVDDSYQLEKVRCPCGSTSFTDSMIQCRDPKCRVWQHSSCVMEKPMEGVPPEPPCCFYCEICRLNRADPFWFPVAHPLYPVKLASSVTSDGANTVVEKTYQLSRANTELLQRTDYDLQVWCILLNDKVPFRMQWPLFADLQVNGVQVRTTNRPGAQQLGINGRDDGPLITTCSREGINKICLSQCDTRVFSFGIRIAKRRTVQQVLNMVPKEAQGESFEDALARVCRCISGGNATENADSDSDLEVVADSVTVNLRCPNGGSRMKIAGRFKPCIHMRCFDLETFVELNQRSRKWQCPICLKNYSLDDLIIDPYFNRITYLLRNCGEDVNEIDVKPDGSWRAKHEGGCRDLAQWHLPDGSLCAATDEEAKTDLKIPKQIKQEDISEGHTGLKFKRNPNGVWELSKPEDVRPPSSESHVLEKFGNHCQNEMPISSRTTGSYRDGEDASVNQEGGVNFDFTVNNAHELDSSSPIFNPTNDVVDRSTPAPLKDSDIIILSDSDEDNVTMISAKDVYGTGPIDCNGIPFAATHPGFGGAYSEDRALRANVTSCLGPFNNDNDDFGVSLWPLQTYSQNGSGFQLFDADANGPDALVDVQQNSLPPLNGYGLSSNDGLGEISRSQDLSTCPANPAANESLVDNPLAYGNDDPSLQIFLPSQPADIPPQPQADLNDHPEMANGVDLDDWISLSLGGAGGGHVDPASTIGLNSKQQYTSSEGRMESLADSASLLLGLNNGNRAKKKASNNQMSDGPFSHPRQPRSVRQRMYLSIDTDSD